MKTLSMDTCIKSLRRMAETRWHAVQYEMAVSLLFFTAERAATREAKGRLAELYASAGYECLGSSDRDYQAIRARIGAASKLFQKLTRQKIEEIVGENITAKMIEIVASEISKLNLCTIVDILEFCRGDKERKPRKVREAEPEGVHVRTMHLDFVVPPSTPYEELIEAINELMAMAQALRGEQVEHV